MEIRVADISRWQGVINWDEFKKNVQGVVIKATGADGGLYTDSALARNRDEARRVGVPIWFYHYKGSGASASEQAQYMLNAIGGLREGEAIVLDDENEAKVNVAFSAEFADKIKQLTGLNIVHYSNQSRYSGVDLKPLADRNIGAWVAKYGMNTGTVEGAGPAPTISGMSIIMWQYTSMARVGGVTANTVDLNVFYGDVAAFKAYGAKNNTPAPSPAPTPSPAPVGDGYYVVQAGETLSGIAAKLNYPGGYQALATANGIANPNFIVAGQRLKVFGGSAGSVSQPANGKTYTVVTGDNLIGIGQKTGVNWQDIARINGVAAPKYIIQPGQVLKLGGGSAPAPSVKTYTVVAGDYLSSIAPRVGVSWQEIARLNGLKDPYTIYPTQVLKLN